MNVIKLDSNTKLNGYRVLDLEEFKSYVSLAGVFTRTISEEVVQQKFFEQLVDRFMKEPIWEEFVSYFDDQEIRRGGVFDTLREYIDYPESVKAYFEDCYLELDTATCGLYYIDDHTPDYKIELEEALSKLIKSITEQVNSWKAEAEEKEQERVKLEAKKQLIIDSYKKQYKVATTSSMQGKIVDECRIVLKQSCGITQTKAEVLYTLTH